MTWVKVPSSLVTGKVRKDLTYTKFDSFSNESVVYENFLEQEDCYLLPANYARKRLGVPIVDVTAGVKVDYASGPSYLHPKASKQQKELMPEILEYIGNKGDRLLIQAGTGCGKTAMSLQVASKLRVSTLIIVDRVALLEQWVTAVREFMGEEPGIIGGGKNTATGKIDIAIVQSLMSDDTVLGNYGLCIVDECDALAAPRLSHAFRCCNAKYWVAMSATSKRKDGWDGIIYDFVGEKTFSAGVEAIPIEIQPFIASTKMYSSGGKPKTKKAIALNDKNINAAVDLVMHGYKIGRNILIACEYIKPLNRVMNILMEKGISRDDIRVMFDPKNNGLDSDNGQRIVMGTYGVILRGVSIDYLDTGINISPLQNPSQLIGRIRRPNDLKTTRRWFLPLYKVEDRDGVTHYFKEINRIPRDSTIKVKKVIDLYEMRKNAKRRKNKKSK